METVYYKEADLQLASSVVTIGNFDGLHIGHQSILRRAREIADQRQVPLVVVSFEPHPGKVLFPQHAPEIIKTQKQKRELLRQYGTDIFFVLEFTPEFSRMSPEAFIEEILIGTLGTAHILVGEGFAFGRKRAGNVDMLRQYGTEHDFVVESVSHVVLDDTVVSSSWVRTLLKNGQITRANQLLGRAYYMEGIVIEGEHLGRELGYPTANIITENELIPMLGVYATRTTLSGVCLDSVTNIGLKPTFGGQQVIVETHIFDFDRDIYGERIRVEFLSFIRPEVKFNAVPELVDEIRNDCKIARRLIDQIKVQQ